MTIPIFGYIRLPLMGDRVDEIVDEFEALAWHYRGSVQGRVYCEKGSLAQTLWSLVQQADRDSRGKLVPHLQQLAARSLLGPVIGHPRSGRSTIRTGSSYGFESEVARDLLRLNASAAPDWIVLPSPVDERAGYRHWIVAPQNTFQPAMREVIEAILGVLR